MIVFFFIIIFFFITDFEEFEYNVNTMCVGEIFHGP
jgi:hypothetical protein